MKMCLVEQDCVMSWELVRNREHSVPQSPVVPTWVTQTWRNQAPCPFPHLAPGGA